MEVMWTTALIICWWTFPVLAWHAIRNFAPEGPSAVPWAVAACILGVPAIVHLAKMLRRKAYGLIGRGRLSLGLETTPPTKVDE